LCCVIFNMMLSKLLLLAVAFLSVGRANRCRQLSGSERELCHLNWERKKCFWAGRQSLNDERSKRKCLKYSYCVWQNGCHRVGEHWDSDEPVIRPEDVAGDRDCTFTPWAASTECNCDGVQTMTRSMDQPATGRGTCDPRITRRTVDCTRPSSCDPCNGQCANGSCTAVGQGFTCTCDTGYRAVNGGRACEGDSIPNMYHIGAYQAFCRREMAEHGAMQGCRRCGGTWTTYCRYARSYQKLKCKRFTNLLHVCRALGCNVDTKNFASRELVCKGYPFRW